MSTSNNTISISIVDDHSLFRNGLKILLQMEPNFTVESEFSNGLEFINSLTTSIPDVVLLDISMPVMDGVEAAKRALEINPDIKIITISMFGDYVYYNKLIAIGVKGFLLKDSEVADVVMAIESVHNGGHFFSPELIKNLLQSSGSSTTMASKLDISERELEVLQLLCIGYSNQEVADKLFISKRTVEKHRASLLEKSESKNSAGLVVFAIKNKLVEL